MSNTNSYEQRVRFLLKTSAALMVVLAGLIFFGLWRTSREFQRAIPKTPHATWAKQPKQSTTSSSKPKWNPTGIADFELTDQHGQTVKKSDLLGSPWVVSFIFSRCAGQCPAIIQQVDKLDEHFKDLDVRFVAISVDPTHDTPETLNRYAKLYGADSKRWLFLTGNQQNIHQLIRDSFQLPVAENVGKDRLPGFEFVHSLSVLHIDSNGKVAGRYDPQKETDLVLLRRALTKEITDSKNSQPSESNQTAKQSTPPRADINVIQPANTKDK